MNDRSITINILLSYILYFVFVLFLTLIAVGSILLAAAYARWAFRLFLEI